MGELYVLLVCATCVAAVGGTWDFWVGLIKIMWEGNKK